MSHYIFSFLSIVVAVMKTTKQKKFRSPGNRSLVEKQHADDDHADQTQRSSASYNWFLVLGIFIAIALGIGMMLDRGIPMERFSSNIKVQANTNNSTSGKALKSSSNAKVDVYFSCEYFQ